MKNSETKRPSADWEAPYIGTELHMATRIFVDALRKHGVEICERGSMVCRNDDIGELICVLRFNPLPGGKEAYDRLLEVATAVP